jgi:predicted alpha/beta hydrolase
LSLPPIIIARRAINLEEKLKIESPVRIPAADGYLLGATFYYSGDSPHGQTVAIINCATGVKASYYARYARFLASHGYLAITYDYRGIGASRPPSLRKLKATKFDWGSKDFEGIMQWVMKNFGDAEVVVVGHSIGGVLPGFSASNWRINRMLTVGAQFAYWKDYAKHVRYRMFFRWHVLMPALTAISGYFPGRFLGWLEDLPSGVAYEWAFRKPTLEALSPGTLAGIDPAKECSTIRYFPALKCPVLAYSITDDYFGTTAAVLRLLNYYSRSDRTHVTVDPSEFQLSEIGHFSFFHDRFKENLWMESLTWLTTGKINRRISNFLPSVPNV